MSAMDGVSSEGACSMGDPIFLPLENALGKKPAKSACCCKCKLRTGVLWMGISLVGPTWAETFLYFGLSFLSERGRGIFLTMAVSVGVGSAIMTHGLWQTYQRNLKGARCLFRFIVVAVFSLLIIMVTMPLWVDGVCVGAMNARHEREMDDCAKPTPAGHLCPGVNMTCGLPIVAIARPSGCTRNVDQTVLASCDTCSVVPECVPATTGDGCVVNPVVISEDERREPECYSSLLSLEAPVLFLSLLYCGYYLYICNSYVVSYEENEGSKMLDDDIEAPKGPSDNTPP